MLLSGRQDKSYGIMILFVSHCFSVFPHSGSVVERLLCDRKVVGSIRGQVIPKPLKWF